MIVYNVHKRITLRWWLQFSITTPNSTLQTAQPGELFSRLVWWLRKRRVGGLSGSPGRAVNQHIFPELAIKQRCLMLNWAILKYPIVTEDILGEKHFSQQVQSGCWTQLWPPHLSSIVFSFGSVLLNSDTLIHNEINTESKNDDDTLFQSLQENMAGDPHHNTVNSEVYRDTNALHNVWDNEPFCFDFPLVHHVEISVFIHSCPFQGTIMFGTHRLHRGL